MCSDCCAQELGEWTRTLSKNDCLSFQAYLCLFLAENLEASAHPIYCGKQRQHTRPFQIWHCHTKIKTAVTVHKKCKCFGREISDSGLFYE